MAKYGIIRSFPESAARMTRKLLAPDHSRSRPSTNHGTEPMTTKYQSELDQISKSLTRLDLDSLLCVTINALVMIDEPSPLMLLKRIANLMVTTSVLFEDDLIKGKCVEMLRNTADVYEHGILQMKQLN